MNAHGNWLDFSFGDLTGTHGKIYYMNSHENWLDFSFGDSTAFTWRDVYFRDDITGYVVGDSLGAAGELFKGTLATGLIQNDNSSGTIAWQEMTMDDHVNITSPTYEFVNCIAFSGPYSGFIGGEYNASTYTNTTPFPYARLIDDEGGVYSQYDYYDRLGRLVVSQNTKQHNYARPAYSYTIYDQLNQITEVGQKTENKGDTTLNTIFGDTVMGFHNPNTISPGNFLAWATDGSGPRTEVNRTYYDVQKILPVAILKQQELRNRVATITYTDTLRTDTFAFNTATHYSYDVHGNVTTLVQDDTVPSVAGQRYKRVDYQYDLVSGKVNQLDYQNDSLDAFHHQYTYDADNRITGVMTSKDSILWDNDANYFYYAHGPLGREEIGDQQVQGIDYAYTLQGWLKGVNSDLLDSNRDMGNDGFQSITNLNRYFARDAYGFTLKYFTGDYDAINSNAWNNNVSRFEARYGTNAHPTDLMSNRNDLFNGNITAMVTSIQQPQKYTNSTQKPIISPQGTAYNYDQLNRLIDMKAYQNLDTNNVWGNTGTYSGLYHNWLTYDGNGNILTQKRADQNGNIFDSLTYQYNVVGYSINTKYVYDADGHILAIYAKVGNFLSSIL